MIILKRDEISEDLYLKTWELDNNTFEGTDLIEKDKALEWFYSSGKRIIIAYDEIKKEVMGYIFYFLIHIVLWFISHFLNVILKNFCVLDH